MSSHEQLVSWIATGSALWVVLSGVLNALFWFRTPEAWVGFCERNPRGAVVVRVLRALGVDPVNGLRALRALIDRRSQRPPDDPPRPPAPPPLPLLTLTLALALAPAGACAPTARQAAHVAVVSAGSALSVVHAEHEQLYREATDALRERLRQGRGTLAEYDAQVLALDRAFTTRTAALVALDGALYGAAGVLDAAREGDAAAYQRAAAGVLAALVRALEALTAGALPAVTLPPELLATREALEALAGGIDGGRTDGGTDGH